MVVYTFEKIKSDAKEAAKKVTDSDTYLGSNDGNEDREFSDESKEPMILRT
jgi:hypothetical protein